MEGYCENSRKISGSSTKMLYVFLLSPEVPIFPTFSTNDTDPSLTPRLTCRPVYN
jgi:hypothetical protein